MQPDQSYNPVPSAPPANQYDFIMNNGADQQKPGKFGLPSGNSTKQRVLIIFGGLLILLIIGFFLLTLLNSGGQSKSEKLLVVAQDQTELIRVSDSIISNKAVRSSTTLVLANNVSLSTNSAKLQVADLLSKGGVKSNDKKLALKLNAQTDTKLTTAAQNNRFDEVATEVLQTELKSYRLSVKSAYDVVSKEGDKKILSDIYRSVGLLLGEKPTTPK